MTTEMSKITFRADDQLITQLEEFDASKSEVMRQALREYLESCGESASSDGLTHGDSLDDIVAERVDALIAERLNGAFTPQQPQDVNVNISLDSGLADQAEATEQDINTGTETSHTSADRASHNPPTSKTTSESDENTVRDERKTCTQCGENLSSSHVYCPNCGEKASHRVFCECGDELRSDWGFCPSCGRRTPAADVLEEH